MNHIKQLLRKLNIDAWVMLSTEKNDPYFQRYISSDLVALSVGIITKENIYIIVHSLDAANIKKEGDLKIFVYGKDKSITEYLIIIFSTIVINTVALNYSTMRDSKVDVLGYGTFLFISKVLKKINKKVKIISAENIIYALVDRKSNSEILKMKCAAKRAQSIILATFDLIKVGMSEKEIVRLTHKVKANSEKKFLLKNPNIVKEEFSWNKNFCPVVLTGKSFLKGGHALPSDTKTKKGNTIYFDFGVKLIFNDETSWSSDIQRTGYILKDQEDSPPLEIQNRFKVIYDSISLGISKVKINNKGYEVDEIVRNHIIKNGYPDYDHATGHAIGEITHSTGTKFSSKNNKLAQLYIQPNGVYTIEPRIQLENGVSVEEMVVCKSDGKTKTLCKRQNKLILIRG